MFAQKSRGYSSIDITDKHLNAALDLAAPWLERMCCALFDPNEMVTCFIAQKFLFLIEEVRNQKRVMYRLP